MKKYYSRKFLNPKNSSMTGAIYSCIEKEKYDGKKRNTYILRLASCHSVSAIHEGSKKRMLKKLKILNKEITKFINAINKN